MAKAIDPFKVVPMTVLASGKLFVPTTEVVLPSVASSRGHFDAISALFDGDDMLPINDALAALKRRWSEVVFDEVCGHWLATWRPHVIAEYPYMHVMIEGKSIGLGFHQVAWLAWRGEIGLVTGSNGEPRRLSIDHLCMLKLCGNPWHLAMKTSAANTFAAREAYRRADLIAMGQQPLFTHPLTD